MKIGFSVTWTANVEFDVDVAKLRQASQNPEYEELIRSKVIREAAKVLDLKNGMITRCDAVPSFEETRRGSFSAMQNTDL